MSYLQGFGGDYAIAIRLPALEFGFGGDYVIAQGAAVLVKIAGQLEERREFIKLGDELLDAGA